MDHLMFFILVIASTSKMFSSNIIQTCDCEINEDALPITSDMLIGSPLVLRQLAEHEEIVHAFVQRDYFLIQDLTYCQRHLMRKYLVHFESSTGKLTHRYKLSGEQVSSRAQNVAWNPIATFLMMRRFRSFLLPLVASLNGTSQQGLFSTITHMMSGAGWPSTASLNASIDAVLRIQQVYDFMTADVVRGKLDGEITGLSISSEESLVIAERALDEGKYALAIEWFEQALSNLSVHHPHREVLVQKLHDTIVMHDSSLESSFTSIHVLQYFYTTKVADILAEKRIRWRMQLLQNWENAKFNALTEVYWGLCTGKTYLTEIEKSQLFCYYESRKHPFLTIAPIKTEVLTSNETVVLQFYDVVDDATIRKLQREASSRLKLSQVELEKAEINLTFRSSLGVFIRDNFRDDIKLGRIVESLTRLKVRHSWTASEDLQVAAYGTGSHYVMHLDTGRINNSAEITDYNAGSTVRVATFLFYLSDVIKGGETSFIQGRVAASPVKGSAVFWFNMMKSSEVDQSSWHGACPVVIGEKWISNKWIRYADQVLQPRCNCDADPESKFTLNDLMSNRGQTDVRFLCQPELQLMLLKS